MKMSACMSAVDEELRDHHRHDEPRRTPAIVGTPAGRAPVKRLPGAGPAEREERRRRSRRAPRRPSRRARRASRQRSPRARAALRAKSQPTPSRPAVRSVAATHVERRLPREHATPVDVPDERRVHAVDGEHAGHHDERGEDLRRALEMGRRPAPRRGGARSRRPRSRRGARSVARSASRSARPPRPPCGSRPASSSRR